MKDVYFAYEGGGAEHRFWKVFRELGYIDLFGTDKDIKNKFLNLEYNSPFRLGFEVLYTFPSSASKPKWSGVMGLERLFGKQAIKQILIVEKDAYNTVSQNTYNLNLAVNGKLSSEYNGKIKIYGTPPTRWLYTNKMKNLLFSIKEKIVQTY